MPGGAPAGLTIHNRRVQRVRRLLADRGIREGERAFVVEGATLVEEAKAAGWTIEDQYTAPGVAPVDGAGAVRSLAAGVAERIADTQSPSGLFAVVQMPPPPADALATAGFVVVADGVADPGNLGTILRSAEAAGVDAVVVSAGSVDPFNPKVVRASAGALFHVPVVAGTPAHVAEVGLRLIGTSSHRGVAHTDADWRGRVAIVAGNEARGIDDDAPIEEWVRIEHRGRAESLNVAMAVTVLCFEAARARQTPTNQL